MGLNSKTIFMSGGSRGIGLAMAKRCARDGANIVIAAKTDTPHPKLAGTIHTAAAEIEAAGGNALGVVCDIRDEDAVKAAVDKAVARFGGIDVCINNASAISLTPTLITPMKRYDLMNGVNARGTFLVSQTCLPHLLKSENPHIMNIAPPLDMNPKWFKNHTAYTMAKYGMSMCTLGMAEEFRGKVAVNSLWPMTSIDTAAVRNVLGGDAMAKMSRTPEIMADAAYAVLTQDAKTFTGQFVIDEFILAENGETDFTKYQHSDHDGPLVADFFVPQEMLARSKSDIIQAPGYEDAKT
jgi:citronellol/citronellal dehydrogenase